MIGLFALAAALAVPADGAVAATDPAAAQRTVQLSAAQVFALAEELARKGRADDAIELLKIITHDRNGEYRAEARARIARLLIARGDWSEAAVWLRKLLDEKPDASAVRLELAAVLAKLGDTSGARRELRQAQAAGLPPQVVQVVRQYAAALRSRKPWGGSLELALAPDSNINRATSATALDTVIAPVTLSQDARRKSGVGVRESSQVYGRIDLAKSLTLVPRLSSQATLYRVSQFTDISASAQMGLEWRWQGDRLTPSVGPTWRWYGGALYARTIGVSLDWLHPAGPRAQLDTSISINRARHARNALQDGTIQTAAISYERALSARSGISVSLSGQRQTARDPGYATAMGTVSGLAWHDWGRATLFVSAAGGRLEADARLGLFPQRRTDWYLRGGLGAVWRKIEVAGFSPLVRITYERNRSSVGIYDFRRLSTDLGLTRSF